MYLTDFSGFFLLSFPSKKRHNKKLPAVIVDTACLSFSLMVPVMQVVQIPVLINDT